MLATVPADTWFPELDLFRTLQPASATSYPKYDILLHKDGRQQVVVAVAGYNKSDLSIDVDGTVVTIKGAKQEENGEEVQYAHRGIAKRAFEMKFQFSDKLKPVGADLTDGILTVTWEPDELKAPKAIPIL